MREPRGAQEARDIALLADPTSWAPAASRLLVDLGFSLINSDRPGAIGGSNLLVALRSRPTLRHFDPEIVSFWVAQGGRGRIRTVDRRDAPVGPIDVSWGSVRVIDRLAVENRFLTFGGVLLHAVVEPAVTVLALRSPGPIVRWGGHSQGSDPLAGEIGAFFGRLMIPVDFTPGAEELLASNPAAVLYAAFVHDVHVHLAASAALRRTEHVLEGWLIRESTRLATLDPAAWDAGVRLREALGLSPP